MSKRFYWIFPPEMFYFVDNNGCCYTCFSPVGTDFSELPSPSKSAFCFNFNPPSEEYFINIGAYPNHKEDEIDFARVIGNKKEVRDGHELNILEGSPANFREIYHALQVAIKAFALLPKNLMGFLTEVRPGINLVTRSLNRNAIHGLDIIRCQDSFIKEVTDSLWLYSLQAIENRFNLPESNQRKISYSEALSLVKLIDPITIIADGRKTSRKDVDLRTLDSLLKRK